MIAPGTHAGDGANPLKSDDPMPLIGSVESGLEIVVLGDSTPIVAVLVGHPVVPFADRTDVFADRPDDEASSGKVPVARHHGLVAGTGIVEGWDRNNHIPF